MSKDDPTRREKMLDATAVANDGDMPIVGGQQRASLIVLGGSEIGEQFDLDTNEQTLGRAPEVAIPLASPLVSRYHARISRISEPDNEHFEIRDLNSSNGTFVNNAPVSNAQLNDGDKIQVGDVLFKFVLQDEADSQFHKKVHELIHYNQLTGLLTLDSFRRYLDQEILRAQPGERFVLAMTDLDGLKEVNDTHGHLAGSMVVREMGAMIRGALRPQDHAGLYGGDEVIILFPQTPMADALKMAEGLRKTFETREFDYKGERFQVTISQGLAEWPVDGEEVDQIIAAADKALYKAKSTGRNCIHTTRT